MQSVIAGSKAEELHALLPPGSALSAVRLPDARHALALDPALLRDELAPLYGRARRETAWMTRALDQVMAVMETAFDPHWREAWTRQQVANSLALPHTYAILVDAEARLIGDGEAEAGGFILARRAPGEKNCC